MRDLLRGYTASTLGRGRVEQLQPSTDRDWIERQQQLTAEIRLYFRTGGRFEFSGLLDISEPLEKSRIQNAALEIDELRNVLLLMDRAAQWREIGLHPPAGMNEPWPAVEELTRHIQDLKPLLGYFKDKLLPDGTLADNASPGLARVRREIEKQRRAIQESLRSYLRRLAEGGAVQDELITIRGERFVIPVKVEQKNRVKGVVHGASSSGQTVYVEPLDTIEQNNELVRLLEEELAEIHRILLEMTRRIAEQAPAISAAAGVLAELELQFAKARFAEDYGCTHPRFGGALVLRKAKHPVLERNLRARGGSVVPMSLELGESSEGKQPYRQLIISGPNTGGKTVALKTVGLLALMAQAGVPVPAERAELPVFDAVLADIGDYQSIEQNLSTFSAHVTNIDFISRTATRHSLVLLDELGSATDPEEGAALAVSIADHFRRIGAVTVISTHHTALKVYAANQSGVLNASVGFDDKTLHPTFQLRVGVPGVSAGINIAQQLGLNPQIIEEARSKVGSQTQEVARFLERLQDEVRAVEQERALLQKREQEIAREHNRLAAEGMNEQRKLVRELERKLWELFRDFEYQMREAVGAVQERAAAQKLSRASEQRIARLRREFKEQFDAAIVAHRTGADQGDANARPGEVKYVEVGDVVRLKSLGREVKVVRRSEDANTFEVEAGLMKMKVPRSDIAQVVRPAAAGSEAPSLKPAQAARARGIQVRLASEEENVPTEINVIGQTVDQATSEVEKFLDRAFLAGLAQVRIVHGSGMGVLRKAIRQFLKSHPHVESIAEPPQNQGGAGATVVDLKS